MNEGDAKIAVVFMDGQIREFYASSTCSIQDGVMVWGQVTIEHRSVDCYSIPVVNVREVFEYE